jgi:hypothetical protein
MRKIRAAIILCSAAALFAACGGGNKGPASLASTGPMSQGQRESAARPLTAAKPIPAGLNCGATKPVWVNLHTKAYHEPDSPYYGRTKSGQYMCPSAATAAGYHAAGTGHANMNGASNGTSSENGTTSSGTSTTPRHHRHHRTSSSSSY